MTPVSAGAGTPLGGGRSWDSGWDGAAVPSCQRALKIARTALARSHPLGLPSHPTSPQEKQAHVVHV